MEKLKHCLLAALGAACLWTPARSAEVELRFAHWVPPQHPIQVTGFEPWAESIKAASNGRIEMQFFPSQQLGAAADHYDLARDGIADLAFINPGYQAGRFPVVAHGEIPFLITNADAGVEAYDHWYRPYAAKEMADVHYCMVFLHDPGTIHSKVPITHPDDIKGKTIRPAQATMARFVNMLGGASVQVPAPEAREVLAKGAADAITFPWNSIYIFGIDSVTHHHLDMPFYVTVLGIVMNKAKYEGMAPEDKAVIDSHCTSEWARKLSAGWRINEASGRQKMLDSPEHFVHVPTEAEVAAWKAAAAPLLDAWKADVAAKGYDADAMHDELVRDLRQANSYYE